jgi:hypothetical protein
MNRIATLGLVGAILCSTSGALAEPSKEGFEVGLRTGYAVPLGNAGGDEKQSDTIAGAIPLWPWIGAGLGYEWLRLSSSGGEEAVNGTLSGFEFVNLQGGVDFKPLDDTNFGVGPFLAFSLAQYSTAADGGDIRDKTLHEWLNLGVRGTFVP